MEIDDRTGEKSLFLIGVRRNKINFGIMILYFFGRNIDKPIDKNSKQ